MLQLEAEVQQLRVDVEAKDHALAIKDQAEAALKRLVCVHVRVCACACACASTRSRVHAVGPLSPMLAERLRITETVF